MAVVTSELDRLPPLSHIVKSTVGLQLILDTSLQKKPQMLHLANRFQRNTVGKDDATSSSKKPLNIMYLISCTQVCTNSP